MSRWLLRFVELFSDYGRDRYQAGLADARNIAEDVENRAHSTEAKAAARAIALRINDQIAARG